MTDPLEALNRSLRVTGELIDNINEADWGVSTPCPQWNLGELVDHLIGSLNRFATALDVPPGNERPASAAEAYREVAVRVATAFGAPGALEREVRVPIGAVPAAMGLQLLSVEVIAHGWDIARASGQRPGFDDADIESAIAFSRSAFAKIPKERQPFAAPQPVPDGAPAADRLAGLLGRTVTEAS